MNKSTKIAILAFALVAPFSASAQFNLGDIGDLINSGVETVKNLTATSNFEAKDLVGTWKYSSPAVSFNGDNVLSNLGGAAASTTIENKLAPYYKKVGFQNSVLTVNNDLTFTWKIAGVTLKGTIEKSKSTDLVFKFDAFNKTSIGSVGCMATKSGSTVSLTFDASKILSIAQKISSVSSNSSFQTINSILSNYKDLYVGVKLKK